MWDEDQFYVAGVVQPRGGPDAGARVQPVPQPPLHGPPAGGPPGLGGGQPFVAGGAGRRLCGESASADPFRATEQVRGVTVEVPAAMPTFAQFRAGLLQPLALRAPTTAPLEDHTRP